MATDPSWGVSAVSLRTPDLRDALAAQDGLYTLAMLGAETRLRVIGSLIERLVAAETPDAVMTRLTDPAIRLVTLTVTEKGYCLAADGRLDLDHHDIVADLASPDRPVSVIGWLVAGLARRRAAGLGPFTVASCDNLPANGRKLKAAVVALAERQDAALARWIEAEAHFPCSMVDSITPATDGALRDRVAAALGVEDAWPVQRETFTQWIVGNDLGPGCEALASAATLTADVDGWERAKLRLLNGAHSTLAYLGLLRGHALVRDAMADSALATFVRRMMLDDIAPTVRPPEGLDLPAYIDALLERFSNPAIDHRLSQIAWDGSQKLPIRILDTVRDALEAGAPLDRLAVPVAAWMRFVVEARREGRALTDPLAGRLAEVAAACSGAPSTDASTFLALAEVFPRVLVVDGRFVAAVTAAYARLPELPA